MSTENDPNQPEGTIPVNEAITLTANWRTFLANSNQEFITRAFLIPIINFKNILLHNPDAEGVRAYIGLEDATDATTAKLVLVPVTNGEDVPILYRDGNGGPGSEEQVNIFDLTRQCPPYCPTGILNE
jgi:hypothetical protein